MTTEDTPVLPLNTVDTSSAMRCYALLMIGIIMTCIPQQIVSFLGSIALIAATIWAYRIRKNSEVDGLLHNHARWMIRTFWIGSLYFLIAMVFWISFVNHFADKTAIMVMAQGMNDHTLTPDLAKGLMLMYKEKNFTLITYATVVFYAPVVFFFLARFFLGYRAADKGQPMGRLQTWLIR